MKPYMDIFRGLKIIEFASVVAGPLVGRFFAELGAEVIKIENKRTGGDVSRNWKTQHEEQNSPTSAYYHAANWGKDVRMIDMKDPKELSDAIKLTTQADIVLSNYRNSTATKFGITYEALKKKNPKLIFLQIDAFKDDNDRPGYDAVLQAETGFLGMNGLDTVRLAKMPVALIDVLTAHQCNEGLLIALLKKERTGEGSYVHVTLEESAIASLINQAANTLNTGVDPIPLGTLHPNISPYGMVGTTSDGFRFILAVGSDSHFERLCNCIDKAELVQDKRFLSNTRRTEYRSDLINILNEEFTNMGSEELLEKFDKMKLPYGRILSMGDVMKKECSKKMTVVEESRGISYKSIRTTTFGIE